MKLNRRTLLKLTGGAAALGGAGVLGWQMVREHEQSTALAAEDLLKVKVEGVYSDPVGAKVVFLVPDEGDKVLRVWIGDAEAMSIASALKGIPFPRPMTHDLLLNAIKALGGKVERVVITDLRDNTFYATVVLRNEKGVRELDARPSDSIALALRAKAPIFLSPKVQKAMEPFKDIPLPGKPERPQPTQRGIET
ncbi:MAG: bifunctional nuclease family protein [Armatimonadetes bacterium]|nr:bifunctional nuclease family protein [Armatimonadota bacterium]MDW8029538.1 bifunctional nuclease family protein [Armatimonadota bacterium]